MPRPPENDLKVQISDMMDREILKATGADRSPVARIGDPNWCPLDDIREYMNIEVPPRALVHAHFEVTEYKRQWMTDGSVIHWIPLGFMSVIAWRKHGDESPAHGLSHQLNVAAYTGIPITVTDPYSHLHHTPQRKD